MTSVSYWDNPPTDVERDMIREMAVEARAELDALRAQVAEITRERDAARADKEIVICSAIRLPDGRIFRGHRHSDCINTAMMAIQWNGGVDPGTHHWSASMARDQGFITSRNRYVDRAEGMRLQRAAGIESVAPGGYRGQLYSEDLY
jgi:hypothetical protein